MNDGQRKKVIPIAALFSEEDTEPNVSARQRVYLDTHLISDLPDEAYKEFVSKLQQSVARARIQVVGSLELLGEFVLLADRVPKKHKRIVRLFWKLCGRRILRPWYELVRDEIRRGRRLSLREAYLDTPKVCEIQNLSTSDAAFCEWSEGVR